MNQDINGGYSIVGIYLQHFGQKISKIWCSEMLEQALQSVSLNFGYNIRELLISFQLFQIFIAKHSGYIQYGIDYRTSSKQLFFEKQLSKNASQSPNINRACVVLMAQEQFWSSVGDGINLVRAQLSFLDDFSQPKATQNHFPILLHQKLLRLQMSMRYVFRLQIKDCPGHLITQYFQHDIVNLYLMHDELLQIPVVQLHHQIQLHFLPPLLFIDILKINDKITLQLSTDVLLSILVILINNFLLQRVVIACLFNSYLQDEGRLVLIQGFIGNDGEQFIFSTDDIFDQVFILLFFFVKLRLEL